MYGVDIRKGYEEILETKTKEIFYENCALQDKLSEMKE